MGQVRLLQVVGERDMKEKMVEDSVKRYNVERT